MVTRCGCSKAADGLPSDAAAIFVEDPGAYLAGVLLFLVALTGAVLLRLLAGGCRYNESCARRSHPGVASVASLTSPHLIVSRNGTAGRTVIEARGLRVGGTAVSVIAGPCAVESREQILEIAEIV